MTKPILKVENLGIRFGGLQAVDNFHLEIGKNELVGLIGPNGAGKTTVFNMLTGVYQPTEGTIELEGVKMNGKKPHQMVEAGISRTFQNIRLFKKMTVLDNVKAAFNHKMHYNLFESMFRCGSYWKEETEVTVQAHELLQSVGLDEYADQLAENLPYGQQRKLEIARALGTGCKVLLLDEPAAGMNPTETAELMNTIFRLREEKGLSILLIEHDMSLVMGLCERLVAIDYGRIIAEGTPYEVANNPKVIAAYLGAEEEQNAESK